MYMNTCVWKKLVIVGSTPALFHVIYIKCYAGRACSCSVFMQRRAACMHAIRLAIDEDDGWQAPDRFNNLIIAPRRQPGRPTLAGCPCARTSA